MILPSYDDPIIQQIQKKYLSLYRFVFIHGKYVFLVIIAIAAFFYAYHHTRYTLHTEKFIIEKTRLVGEFDQQRNNISTMSGIDVYILQGSLQQSLQHLSSTNNLVTYRGYILPRFFSVEHQNTTLWPVTDLAGSSINIQKLQGVTQQLIIQSPTASPTSLTRPQLPLDDGVINTFNISCIFGTKIISYICDQYVKNMTNTVFVYGIHTDYEGMKNVLEALPQDSLHRENLCTSLHKYVRYSKNTDIHTESLLHQCGKQEAYDMFVDFIAIQAQLKEGYIDDTVYTDTKLNAYKLLSYQQLIAQDTQQQRINLRRFNTYVTYVEQLLKTTAVDQIYIDIMYRFHNERLVPALQSQATQNNDTTQIVDRIRMINQGNSLIGYPGLDTLTNIETVHTGDVTHTGVITAQLTAAELLAQTESLSFLTITDNRIVDTNVFITGYIHTTSTLRENLSIMVSLQLDTAEYPPRIVAIDLLTYPTFTKVLQDLIAQQPFSIPAMYQYISQNIALYSQEQQQLSLCDRIENALLMGVLQSCNETQATITKSISTKQHVTYTLQYDNYAVTDMTVSDDILQTAVRNAYANTQSDQISFPRIIADIIAFEPTEETANLQDRIDDTATLLAAERFENHLQIDEIFIAEKDEKLMVQFSLDGITFVGAYNTDTYTIETLYFRNISYNDQPLVVKQFNLALTDKQKTNINAFRLDPLSYIKTINPIVHDAYMRFK